MNVLLLQFDTDPESGARRRILHDLAGAGTGTQPGDYVLLEDQPRWPTFFEAVTLERPDVIVIACSKLPQHAREAARYLGEGFNTRDIPVVLVDVGPKELESTKAYVQRYHRRALFVDRRELAAAVTRLASGDAKM